MSAGGTFRRLSCGPERRKTRSALLRRPPPVSYQSQKCRHVGEKTYAASFSIRFRFSAARRLASALIASIWSSSNMPVSKYCGLRGEPEGSDQRRKRQVRPRARGEEQEGRTAFVERRTPPGGVRRPGGVARRPLRARGAPSPRPTRPPVLLKQGRPRDARRGRREGQEAGRLLRNTVAWGRGRLLVSGCAGFGKAGGEGETHASTALAVGPVHLPPLVAIPDDAVKR